MVGGGGAGAPRTERFRVTQEVEVYVVEVAPDNFRVEAAFAMTASFTALDRARAAAYNVARAELERLLALRRKQVLEAERAARDLGSMDYFRLGMYRVAEREEEGDGD